jgi:hypothetical protein
MMPEPDRFYRALDWLTANNDIDVLLRTWPNVEDDCRRWAKWCEVRDRGVAWDDAAEQTAKELSGSPAKGGPDTMVAAYKKVQAQLPKHLKDRRRPRGPNRH